MDQYLFDRVFSIKLTSTEILKYCGAKELICLRETSKLLNQVVTDSEAFSTNCRVIIGIGTVNHPVMQEISWENARVDLSFNNEGIHRSLYILENIKDIKFTVSNETNVPRVINIMLSVLTSVRVLKTLTFELELFDVDLDEVFEHEQIKGIIENIEELHIFACDEDLEAGDFTPTIDSRVGPIFRNFRKLSRMDLRLKSFHMPHVKLGDTAEVLRSFPNFLSTCEDTLEDVTLFHDVWSHGWMNTIVCENLKTVDIKSDNVNGRRVSTFLYNHTNMEQLKIEMTNGFSYRILQALTKVSSNLTSLNLMTMNLDFLMDEDDWNFLKNINGMKEFSFTQSRLVSNPPVISDLAIVLLTTLPANINKLTLDGIEDIWQQNGLPISFGLKTELLLRFKQIKYLSLVDSPNALDDETLGIISQEFKQLKSFKFSDCESVTSYGVSCICKGLEKLETLEVKRCISLNMDSLSGVLEHSRLKDFQAFTMDLATLNQMIKITSNNPNLRSISLHITEEPDLYDFPDLKKKLQVYAPQLTIVRNEIGGD